uniref:EXS domain-containing protein n=1 Tax=Mesocestoides corti TaxID=53468 RepID=A0A5K3FZL9_MESCO
MLFYLADNQLFHQTGPSSVKMGAYYAPNELNARDDFPILPPHPTTTSGTAETSMAQRCTDPPITAVNTTTIYTTEPYEYPQTPQAFGNESKFTRVSLFLGSFCLFMFNPFIIMTGDANQGGANSAGMPVRRLISALSLSVHHYDDGGGSSMLGPLLLSIMYAAQWIVAILLFLLAKPHDLRSFFPSILGGSIGYRKRGLIDKLPGRNLALRHWRQSEEDMRNGAWHSAGSQLKASLTALGESPCFSNGVVSAFCARVKAYAEGIRLVLHRLPQLLWLVSRKCHISCKSQAHRNELPTVSQLRRRLLDLRYLDFVHLSDNNPMPQGRPTVADMPTYECLHVLRLMFACLEDFVVDWRASVQGDGSVDLAELTRLGMVLALSVKRFFGVNWLGNLLLRATRHLAEELNDDCVLWLGPSTGPVMRLLLSSTPLDFSHLRIHPGEEFGIFTSPLNAHALKLASNSLVADEVNSEICEAVVAKALEV